MDVNIKTNEQIHGCATWSLAEVGSTETVALKRFKSINRRRRQAEIRNESEKRKRRWRDWSPLLASDLVIETIRSEWSWESKEKGWGFVLAWLAAVERTRKSQTVTAAAKKRKTSSWNRAKDEYSWNSRGQYSNSYSFSIYWWINISKESTLALGII